MGGIVSPRGARVTRCGGGTLAKGRLHFVIRPSTHVPRQSPPKLPVVHPYGIRKWQPNVTCAVCGHPGKAHLGLWHDDKRIPTERNAAAISTCWLKCRKCPKIGGRIRVCFDDGCDGHPRVSYPLESEAKRDVQLRLKVGQP